MESFDSKYQSKLLRLSAHDRDRSRPNQTNSDFSIDIKSQNTELKKIVAIQVVNCQIPNVFYNIPDGLNTFNFDDALSAPQTVTITPGQYQLVQFMDAFLDLIDTKLSFPLGTSSYVFDDITNKITITFPEIITFTSHREDNPLLYKLGYGFDVYSGTTIAASYIINLIGPHTVSIHSPEISNGVLDYGSRSSTVRMIAQVPLDNPFGSMCYFNATTNSDIIKYQSLKSINRIRLVLRDIQGRRLDIQEHDWNMTLKIWYLL